MKYYTMNDFNIERLDQIIESGRKIHDEIISESANLFINTIHTDKYRKTVSLPVKMESKLLPYLNLMRQNELYNDKELEILKMNIIFPDDSYFINKVTNGKTDLTFINFIEKIEDLNLDGSDDKKSFVRTLYISQYIKNNKDNINNLFEFFKPYLDNYYVSYLYNRLLQIKYTNNDLYNEYLDKNKTLTKSC